MTAPAGSSYRVRRARIHFLRKGATFDAEIAQTREELVRGLRDRRAPSPMLFLFPYSSPWSMTMSGVRVSLDMLFLDDAGTVVDLIEEAPPQKLQIVPAKACRYVLELPGGWANGMGLALGDRAMILPLVG